MAHALPARPNLDWLRKTAKQALRDLRVQQPEARLADAQLAVARNYGFSSWRALKAHVDELLQLARSGRARRRRRSHNSCAMCGPETIDAVRAALAPLPRWSMPTVRIRTGVVGRSRCTWPSKERIAKYSICCSRPAPT